MKTTSTISWLAVGAMGAATAYHYLTLKPPAHAVVEIDPSVSVEKTCPELRRSADAMLQDQRSIRKGSTLTVMVMGRSAANPEPRPEFSQSIPIPSETVYGQDKKKFDEEQRAFFDDIEQVCESAKATRNSPIYVLMQRGIDHLRSAGCVPDGECFALLKSDLDEDVQPELRRTLQQAAKDGDAPAPVELAGSLDNAGIRIVVCGTSEVRPVREGGQSIAPPEVRIRVWRQLLSPPELLSVHPFCGQ